MKKTFFLFFLAAAPMVTLEAAGPPANESGENPGSMSEALQEVLFLGNGQPALLRLQLYVEGKSVFEKHESWMRRLFRFLDRNESGWLDRIEGGKAPSVAQLLQFLQGNLTIFPGRAVQPAVAFDQLDADRDGRVTFEEFIGYYRTNGADAVQVGSNMVSGGSQDSLTETLFDLLDLDKDGKLSRIELLKAEQTLLVRDQNDDELVSVGELGGLPNRGGRGLDVSGRDASARLSASLLLVQKDEGGRRRTNRLKTVRDLLGRLDKDSNRKLSLDESRFPQTRFQQLDRNKDKHLDALELARWMDGPADGEFLVRLSRSGGGMPRAGLSSRGAAIQDGGMDSRQVQLGNVQLSVVPVHSVVPPFRNLTQSLLKQFRTLDREKKGLLLKKQLNAQQDYTLWILFDMADRNHDARLSEEELREFVDLYSDAYGCQVTLSLVSTGQGMFPSLDSNGDGQLSIRELRQAWSRLAGYDRDGDEAVNKREFPQQFQLRVILGQNVYYQTAVQFFQGREMSSVRVPDRGPMWFRKMDRNGDGDVSRKEWLGTREDFNQMDSDKDQLISLSEAELADARARKKAE